MRRVSFLILTRDRYEELKACINSILEAISYDCPGNVYEIIILNNGGNPVDSHVLYKSLAELIKNKTNHIMNSDIELKMLYREDNVGVAEGRNILYRESSGDILIFLDDDSEILEVDSFLRHIVDIYNRYNGVAIIAVESVDAENNIIKKEVPLGGRYEKECLVSSFVGVCHIIFKRYFKGEKCLYPPNLFYGMEEFYLSYKTINRGLSILYCPFIKVRHFKSSKSRVSGQEYFVNLASNKIYISYLLTNKFLYYSYLFLWCAWAVCKTKRFSVLSKIIKRLEQLKTLRKDDYVIKLKPQFFIYMIKNRGHIFY